MFSLVCIAVRILYHLVVNLHLTLSLLMSHINGALSKARNLTYIYMWMRFFTVNFAS
jgi:hypothetical protein